jgi:hypothetical protein
MLRTIRYTVTAMVFALSPLYMQPAQADADVDHGLQQQYNHHANHEDRDFDPVFLSFSTVGDSRQDSNPAKADPTTQPVSGQDQNWHQNTKAWSRIIRTVEDQKSDFLFFNGDMIMGYGNADVPADTSTVDAIVASDLVRMSKEYAFWRGMVADLMETGTYVVPVPGNHEVQCKTCPDGSKKKAQVVNENAWRANMGDLILDDSRLTTMFGHAPAFENVSNNGPADGLATDQSQLSYSFDFNGSHFVVINTDPVGDDAHAPVVWLSNDLAAAKSRGMQHIFVFGHKPAYTYYFGADAAAPNPDHPAGLDNDPASRDAFWSVIEEYNATYFCGHEHIYHMSQPTKDQGGKAWQVLVGSGGSPFEAAPTDATVNPQTDRDYAWATVRVHRSGHVDIKVYGFNDQFGPTQVLQSATLPQ